MRQSSARPLKYQRDVAAQSRGEDTSFPNVAAEKRVYERRLHQKGLSDTEVEVAVKGIFEEGCVTSVGFGSSSDGARTKLFDPTHSGTPSAVPQTAVESDAASSHGEGKSASGTMQSRIPEGENDYVISLARRGRNVHKKLHYLGQCHFTPGVDYLRYEWMGPQRPGATFYDSVCTRC